LRIGANEGDEIVIVSGAPTPIVLRRTFAANKYALGSDAYSICGAVYVGKLCKKRESFINPTKINRVCDSVELKRKPQSSNLQHRQRFRSREKGEGEEKREQGKTISAKINHSHTD